MLIHPARGQVVANPEEYGIDRGSGIELPARSLRRVVVLLPLASSIT